MEKSKCEESRQAALDFKCKKIIPAPVQRLETKIASFTPEKTNEPLNTNYEDKSLKLPEKYKALAELFDRMNCSLRLLNLRKKLPTFQNISTQVEILSKRKFLYRHLAQIKYILPEAIQIDKILTHDEKTLCMKADMKITVLFDVIEGHHEQSAFLALRQVFVSRVLSFFNRHPEDCDIPEAVLPVMFNQRNQAISPEALPVDSSMESESASVEVELLSDSSHPYPFVSRHFSRKAVVAETEKTQLLASPVTLKSAISDCVTSQNIKSGQQNDSINLCSKSPTIKPPEQLIYSQCSVSPSAIKSPFVKPTVTDGLMVETPTQSTPKRSMPSCDNNLKNSSIKKWTLCQKPAKRSLDFSHLEGGESGLDYTTCKVVHHTIPHHTNPQPVLAKGNFMEENLAGAPAVLQKVEQSIGTSRDQKMSQTGLVMHPQMSACLPGLVALIQGIFESCNCSSITKEELVHKIIMENCDIVERREVEEQIELLEKLVPDWICRKLALSGDLLYSISKVADVVSVRARLFST